MLGGIWERGSFYLPWWGDIGNLEVVLTFPSELSPSFPQRVNTSIFICFFFCWVQRRSEIILCQPFQCSVSPFAGIHIWHSHSREEGRAGGEILQHRSRHREQRGPRAHPCLCPGSSPRTAPNLRYVPSQLLLWKGT